MPEPPAPVRFYGELAEWQPDGGARTVHEHRPPRTVFVGCPPAR